MKFRALIVLCLLCACALSAAAAPWQAKETTEDGVPVVLNPDTPRDGTKVLTAREAWRLGADEENDPLLMRITGITTDAAGNAYVLDGDLSKIYVMSPQGELLRTIGREGDGPGEFRNADQVVEMPDGNLGVLQVMPGKVVVIDPFGEPRPTFRFGEAQGSPMMFPGHLEVAPDGVVFGNNTTTMGDGKVVTTRALARYRPDGSEDVVYIEDREEHSGGEVSFSMGGDDDFVRNWTLTGDGTVVVYRNPFRYELQLFAPDGSPSRIIRRDYKTLRRPDDELAEARKQAEEMSARFQGMRQEVEERSRDITAVFGRPDGELWVANSAGDRERRDGIGILDVFDKDGRFTHTLRLEGVQYDPDRDSFLIEGNRLFVLREAQALPDRTMSSGGGGMQMMMIQSGGTSDDEDDGEHGPHEVVCYELD